MQNIGGQDLAEKLIKFDAFRSKHPAKERGSYELRSFVCRKESVKIVQYGD